MNILRKITSKNLKLNKKRTIVTIIGIILSVALITAVSTMFSSGMKSLVLFEQKETGNFHVSLTDVDKEDLKYFYNNRKLSNVMVEEEVGFAKLDNSANENKPYAYIAKYDEEGIKSFEVNVLEGRLPENENELVISSSLKSNGNLDYKVGDKITLNVGTREIVDETNEYFVANESYPYDTTYGEEKIVDATEKTYTIVGIMERPSYKFESYDAPGYSMFTVGKIENPYKVYIKFEKKYIKDYLTILTNMMGIKESTLKLMFDWSVVDFTEEDYENALTDYNENAKFHIVDINNYLMSLDNLDLNDSTIKSLVFIVGIVLTIIVITSVFCIKNSFNISITEKIKQFGMLSSIGATRKQIRKMVLSEAFMLGLIGIPLGLLLGFFASFILIIVSNILLKGSTNLELILSINIYAILLSILLSIITLYLSSIKSAFKASRLSPLVAIRGNDDVKIKSKKIRTPKIINKLFGVGGVITYKNLKRNKKKYRTAVISIIVCVAAFIPLSYFVDSLFGIVRYIYVDYNYNISITPNNDSNSFGDKLDKLITSEYIDEYSIVRNDTGIILDSSKLTSIYKSNFAENYCIDEDCFYTSEVIALGKESYTNYLKELGLNYDDMKNKAIILNNYQGIYAENDNIKRGEIDITSYEVGDTIKLMSNNLANEETSVTVGFVTNKYPVNEYGASNKNLVLVVSDEFFDKNFSDEVYTLYVKANDPAKYQDYINNIFGPNSTEFKATNIAEEAESIKDVFILMAIFLYGFIIVVALIGITNIFNTITTSMELRKREFATLKSVGMTSKEFNRMISLESLFYGVKSLIIGIPIGTLLSYLMSRVFDLGQLSVNFNLPLKGIIIATITVFILLFVIMKYSIGKTKDQNIIETIRNDNI